MTSDKIPRDTDTDLAARFALMRQLDAGAAPPFPHSISAEKPARATHVRLVKLGLAAANVAGIGFSVSRLATQHDPDPAALYTRVMANYSSQTDELLAVTIGSSPEMLPLPELLGTEWPAAIEELNP